MPQLTVNNVYFFKPGFQRFRGALLGLACGDAVGTTLEFKAPGSFKPIDDMVGGGPFKLEVGQWTDDTSMALCLAESLLEKQGFDPADQMVIEHGFEVVSHGFVVAGEIVFGGYVVPVDDVAGVPIVATLVRAGELAFDELVGEGRAEGQQGIDFSRATVIGA